MRADDQEAYRLFDAWRAALEGHRAADSPETTVRTEAEVLLAEDRVHRAIGATTFHQQRGISDALGLAPGERPQREDADYATFIGKCLDGTLPPGEGENRMRRLLARFATDFRSRLLRAADLLAHHLLQNAKGRRSAFDSPYDFLAFTRRERMDQLEGAADEARNLVVNMVGYTLGWEIGATGPVPHPVWLRAERYHHGRVEKGRALGFRIKPAAWRTIKDWCERAGPLADQCRDARAEAAVWTEVEPAKLLPD